MGNGKIVHASTYGVPVAVVAMDNAPIYNIRRYTQPAPPGHDWVTAKSQCGAAYTYRRGGPVGGAGILSTVRTRGRLLASALTCTVLIAATRSDDECAGGIDGRQGCGDLQISRRSKHGPTIRRPLAPGGSASPPDWTGSLSTFRDPSRYDTRDDTYRIKIGDPDANGRGNRPLLDESSLKYVDLGNRGGIYYALFNDGEDVINGGPAPARHGPQDGNTYVVSGYATGTTANQPGTGLYFGVAVACP